MLRTRLLTALVGIPLWLGALWLGGLYYAGAVSLLAALAVAELLPLTGAGTGAANLFAGWLGASAWMLLAAGHQRPGLAVAVVFVLVLAGRQVIRYPELPSSQTAGLCLSTVFAGLSFGCFLALRALPSGLAWSLLVVLLTWAFDSAAYLIGSRWGRHRLAPRLSPGKSWEGAIAGSVAALAVAVLPWSWWPVPLAARLAAAVAVIVFGQVGDLFESSLKRFAGRKDSGWLLPGHGGVLDRFDSLMFAVPAVYYVALLWARYGY